jgi:diacylglycerol kinase (ATP)
MAAREPGKPEEQDPSPYKGAGGLVRIWNATTYSCSGLASAFRHEAAFRQEVLLAAILIPAAFVLDVARIERALLLASVLLVMIVELLNACVEAVVDRISLERHPLAKRAKDMGSAAVMLSLVVFAVVWGSVLWPFVAGAA